MEGRSPNSVSRNLDGALQRRANIRDLHQPAALLRQGIVE
jgi:hypothetical protein